MIKRILVAIPLGILMGTLGSFALVGALENNVDLAVIAGSVTLAVWVMTFAVVEGVEDAEG